MDGTTEALSDTTSTENRPKSSPISEKSPRHASRPRPTHFLAFRVTDPGILTRVEEIQSKAINESKHLSSILIKLSKMHITLNVMHLKDEDDIQKVVDILDGWRSRRLASVFETPVRLQFKGINSFPQGVLFASLSQNENYSRLCGIYTELAALLTEAGFEGDYKFKPHLTLFKLSKEPRMFRFRNNVNRIFRDLKNTDYEFGEQNMEHVQLLAMSSEDKNSDYYKCCHEISTTD